MKKKLPVLLTAFLIFLFSGASAQTNDLLKGFINKNDFALRSVQKHTILAYSDANALAVKSILKLHLVSIHYFESNPALSKQAAYQARTESIKFLNEHSDVPSQTFSLKDKELAFFGKPHAVESPDGYLEKTDLKKISELDVKDPASLNSFITSISN